MLRLLLSTALGLASLQAAAAQETPQETLTDLVCDFDQGVERNSDDRGTRQDRDRLKLTFRGIDLATGTAALEGPQGMTGVAIVASSHIVTFVEVMPSGNVSATTVSIVEPGEPLPAVHSKHVFDSFTPRYIASQLYGSCAPP